MTSTGVSTDVSSTSFLLKEEPVSTCVVPVAFTQKGGKKKTFTVKPSLPGGVGKHSHVFIQIHEDINLSTSWLTLLRKVLTPLTEGLVTVESNQSVTRLGGRDSSRSHL